MERNAICNAMRKTGNGRGGRKGEGRGWRGGGGGGDRQTEFGGGDVSFEIHGDHQSPSCLPCLRGPPPRAVRAL
jgi:hypothetical protein